MNILNTTSLKSNKQIKINFDGGDLSSDAGLLLIKEFVSKCNCMCSCLQYIFSKGSLYCAWSFKHLDKILLYQFTKTCFI